MILRLILGTLLFLPLNTLAAASQSIEVILNGESVQFEVHSEGSANDVKFEKPVRTAQEGVLLFSRPEEQGIPASEVKISLLRDFAGMRTLKKDIKAAGFTNKEILSGPKDSYEQRLIKGRFFRWSEPTVGSNEYYCLQSPTNRRVALRIGPIPGTVMKDFTFDWSKVKWSKR